MNTKPKSKKKKRKKRKKRKKKRKIVDHVQDKSFRKRLTWTPEGIGLDDFLDFRCLEVPKQAKKHPIKSH